MSIQNKTEYNSNKKACIIELASSATSVAVYHPFRTIATFIITGTSGNIFSPKTLYKGFSGSAMASHQLFVMGTADRMMRQKFAPSQEVNLGMQILFGAISGAISTVTITPFEAMSTHNMISNEPFKWRWHNCYRSTFPVCLRQMGLGAGMFPFPKIIAAKVKESYPDVAENHPFKLKVISGFIAGSMSAVSTQIPEMARTLMQKDSNKTTSQAFKDAVKMAKTTQGVKALAARIVVLAVATVVMNSAREAYIKIWGV